MDRAEVLEYTAASGLPQESKLVTYMNRSATPGHQSSDLNDSMQNLTLEPSQTADKVVGSQLQHPPNIFIPGQSNQAVNSQLLHQPMIFTPGQSNQAVGSQLQHPPNIFPAHHQPQNMYAPGQAQALFSPPVSQPIYTARPQGLYHLPPHQMAMYSPNHPQLQAMFSPHQFVLGEYDSLNCSPLTSQNSPPHPRQLQVNAQVHQENVGGTTYFFPASAEALNPSVGINQSGAECLAPGYGPPMYAPPPIPSFQHPPPGLALTYQPEPEPVKAELYNRNDHDHLNVIANNYLDEIPAVVDIYCELAPLEPSGHCMATSFRATHRTTGEIYALRRLHGCTISAAAMQHMKAWRAIDHPNVVRLHRVFNTAEFGDHSVVMVYDYHPMAATLMSKYLSPAGTGIDKNSAFHDPFSSDPDAPRPYTHQKNAMLRAAANGALLSEDFLWSVFIQLTTALRAIHSCGLACRMLVPSKVIINGNRVRISWSGFVDAVHPPNADIVSAQQEDLAALGRIILSLACRTVHCDNLSASLELISCSFSNEFKTALVYLLCTITDRLDMKDLMPLVGKNVYKQVEALERQSDAFEEQLAKEIDNGRLLRIVVKLGVVNERPELNMDQSWSETGDRYMLKLFRDHVFHSTTRDGRPWVDQAHVTNALNLLDSGSPLKVELMSRDEQSVLVVSYAELKHCLDAAFTEIMSNAGVDRDTLQYSAA